MFEPLTNSPLGLTWEHYGKIKVQGQEITGTNLGNTSTIGPIYSNYGVDSYDSGWTQSISGFDTIRYYLLGKAYDRWSRLWVDDKLAALSNNSITNEGVYHIDPSTTHTIKITTDYKCGNAYFTCTNT